MAVQRDTQIRDRIRKILRKSGAPCHICGKPIDYDLGRVVDPQTEALVWHPMSFVRDHVIPLSRGGEDTLANSRAAHRICNRTKSDRMDGGGIIRRSGALR